MEIVFIGVGEAFDEKYFNVHINRFVRQYDLINIKKIFQKEGIKILFPELNEKIKV